MIFTPPTLNRSRERLPQQGLSNLIHSLEFASEERVFRKIGPATTVNKCSKHGDLVKLSALHSAGRRDPLPYVSPLSSWLSSRDTSVIVRNYRSSNVNSIWISSTWEVHVPIASYGGNATSTFDRSAKLQGYYRTHKLSNPNQAFNVQSFICTHFACCIFYRPSASDILFHKGSIGKFQ